MVLPAVIAAAQPGDALFFVPPNATHERYGQRVTVLRAARTDVRVPSLRVRFSDGVELRVPGKHLRVVAVRLSDPPFLVDARARPAWKRLVRALSELHGQLEPALTSARMDAEHRARLLAGMVVPRGSHASTTADVARVLLDAAQAEANWTRTQVAQRGGRGPTVPAAVSVPPHELAEVRLDQAQRAMVNRIALAIHRRYLLSDKEVRALTDVEREQGQIRAVLGHLIGLEQKASGHVAPTGSSPRKGSALHGEAHDALMSAYQLALEVSELTLQGREEDAHTLALQVREKKLTYLAARTVLNQQAVRQSTGRYFHGDILSVRVEHEDVDAHGRRVAYHGMTQYYARFIVVHHADGHTVQVVNSAELEAVTGTRAGPLAWASLCHWIEDHSSRAGGRKQGRRQDDDTHLIYRNHDGHLERRESLQRYPDLLKAFEVIRRALYVDLPRQDITAPELGQAPRPGFHAASAGADTPEDA